MSLKSLVNCIGFSVVLASSAFASGPHVDPMVKFGRDSVAGWMQDPTVVAAIKAQNSVNGTLSEAEIIALDKQWRAETKVADRPLIDGVLTNDLSKYLAKIKEQEQGLVTEIFVMDFKGLNVGQSDVTSDFWQGDEPKWQETYLKGKDAYHISDVEQDESTQIFQSQLSLPVIDPSTSEVIGAVTVGVNIEALMH